MLSYKEKYTDITFIENDPVVFESMVDKERKKHSFLYNSIGYYDNVYRLIDYAQIYNIIISINTCMQYVEHVTLQDVINMNRLQLKTQRKTDDYMKNTVDEVTAQHTNIGTENLMIQIKQQVRKLINLMSLQSLYKHIENKMICVSLI